jgi:hypothetical protein
MTLSRGWHGAAGGFVRAAAAGCAVAAIFAGVWAGPALASSSVPRSGTAAVAAPAAVKYYIVPVPGPGGTETLYDIALRTLGNGSRYPEIFNLNEGRLQPNGARMEDPRSIDSGWILQLPADARGPGVRFGPLPAAATSPATAAPTTAPVSRPPSAPVAAASHGGSLSTADAIGGLLILVLLVGLAVLAVRRPWLRPWPRPRWRAGRRGQHGRAAQAQSRDSAPSALAARVAARIRPRSAPPADGQSAGRLAGPGAWYPAAADRPGGRRPDSVQADRSTRPGPGRQGKLGAGRRQAVADQPGFAGASRIGPFGREHPRFPGAGHLGAVGPDYRPACGADPRTLGPSPLVPGQPAGQGPGHLSPPGPGYGTLGPDHPSFPGAGHLGTVGPEQLRQFDTDPFGTMGPDHPSFPGAGHLGTVRPDQPDWRGGGQPAGSRSISQRAGAPADWPPARPRGGSGGGQSGAALAPVPRPGPAQVPAPSGRHAVRQVAERPPPGPSQELVPWNADSIRLAERMLADADEQATMIVTTAQRTAAEISQSAAEQAAAALTAAEQEAAQVRESLAEITAQLGRVAASVMENLTTPLKPSRKP